MRLANKPLVSSAPHTNVCPTPTPFPHPIGTYCRPFLMQAKMSYTKIGLFSLASYPYRQAPALGSAAAEQGSDGCCLGPPWCYCCCRFVFKICPPAVELATHRRACMCWRRYAADAPPRLPCRSFKLLWSPFVDSVYWPAVGRRRSWILPLQVGIGADCRSAGGGKPSTCRQAVVSGRGAPVYCRCTTVALAAPRTNSGATPASPGPLRCAADMQRCPDAALRQLGGGAARCGQCGRGHIPLLPSGAAGSHPRHCGGWLGADPAQQAARGVSRGIGRRLTDLLFNKLWQSCAGAAASHPAWGWRVLCCVHIVGLPSRALAVCCAAPGPLSGWLTDLRLGRCVWAACPSAVSATAGYALAMALLLPWGPLLAATRPLARPWA